MRHVGEVGNEIGHPVSEAERLHRWCSDLESVFFCLIKNCLDFAILLGDLLINTMFWKGNTLRDSHLVEVAPLHALQITPVAGLNISTVLHHDHEDFGAYLAEVMGNDDGSLVLAPLFDRLGH